jgi:hypothetical protein
MRWNSYAMTYAKDVHSKSPSISSLVFKRFLFSRRVFSFWLQDRPSIFLMTFWERFKVSNSVSFSRFSILETKFSWRYLQFHAQRKPLTEFFKLQKRNTYRFTQRPAGTHFWQCFDCISIKGWDFQPPNSKLARHHLHRVRRSARVCVETLL